MSELAATQIPKPVDEQAFERCNLTLWRCVLNDPRAHTHGRRGQRQHGIDIVGCRDGVPTQIVGIQCKLKSAGKILDEKEVREEFAKALTFKPPLAEFIIVTTAPDDGKLQRLALELSICESANRGTNITIRVLGWDSLQQEIRRHPQAVEAFDPSHTPFGKRLESKIDDLPQILIGTVTKFINDQQSLQPASSDDTAQGEWESQIDEYIKLINTDPETALGLFGSLRARLDPSTPGRVLWRIQTNIAVCQLALGRSEVAAGTLIAAYDAAPNDPKAVANKALGFLLNKDWPSLQSFAQAKLAEFPDNADLAAHYVHSLIADEAIIDPLIHVPEEVRDAPQVIKAKVEWLMRRGTPGSWRQASIAAYRTHPNNDELQLIYATALLDRITNGGTISCAEVLRKDQRADIEEVVSIYEARWAEMRDGVRQMIESQFIPVNLINAYRLLRNGQRTVEIGRQALEQFPEDEEVKKCLSAALAEQGEIDQAAELIRDLGSSPDAMIAGFELSLAKLDWVAVSGFVSSHLGKYSGPQQELLRAAGVRAEIELSTLETDRRSVLLAAQNQFQGNLRALILLSQGARIYGQKDLATKYFQEALSALDCGDNGLAPRLLIANEAMARGEPRIAADVLIDRLALDRDSPELRLLAEALVRDYPIRNRAVEFFRRLDEDVQRLPVFRRLEGILHVNRGVPEAAVAPLRAVFDELPGVDTLLHLITAHLRVGNRADVERLLRSKDFDGLPGSPLDRINFCHVLLDFGEAERALELGYQAMIEGLDDVEVVNKFLGLILVPSSRRPEIFDVTVTAGVWFRLIPSLGEDCVGLMGEVEDRPWEPRVDPNNGFFAKALGKKTGDTFDHTNVATGATETWTVAEVKPRWLQAFHHLTKSYAQRFPTSTQFASLPLSEDDVEPALEQVRDPPPWGGPAEC